VDYFLKGFLSTKGRIGRTRFLLFSLSIFMSVLVFGTLWVILPFRGMSLIVPTILLFLFCVLSMWANCAVMAKRLHDLNKSAWNLVWMFIPGLIPFFIWNPLTSAFSLLVTSVITAWLLFAPGTRGGNRFGPMPS